MKNADMPAMPSVIKVSTFEAPAIMSGVPSEKIVGGLTKREIMAMHALGYLCTSSGQGSTYEDSAHDAVRYADALLAELDRTSK